MPALARPPQLGFSGGCCFGPPGSLCRARAGISYLSLSRRCILGSSRHDKRLNEALRLNGDSMWRAKAMTHFSTRVLLSTSHLLLVHRRETPSLARCGRVVVLPYQTRWPGTWRDRVTPRRRGCLTRGNPSPQKRTDAQKLAWKWLAAGNSAVAPILAVQGCSGSTEEFVLTTTFLYTTRKSVRRCGCGLGTMLAMSKLLGIS